jgi:hypothetical protein
MTETQSQVVKKTHRPLKALWICLGLLAVFALMAYSAEIQKCATYDEPLHSVAGQTIRSLNDFRIDPEDPALFTQFSTIPHGSGALWINGNRPSFQEVFVHRESQWPMTIETLYRTPGNDGGTYIARSRILFLLVGVGLGALLGWWAFRISGVAGAIIAISLFAFDPNFLAHSPLVKNDVPMTLLMLWLSWALWRTGQRATLGGTVSIALACAAAINVKYSGLLFGVIVPATLIVRALMNRPWRVLKWDLCRCNSRLLAVGLICTFAAMVSWGVTWTVYHFRYSETPDPNIKIEWGPLISDTKLRTYAAQDPRRPTPTLKQLESFPVPLPVRVVQWLDGHHLLPRAWLTGFLFTYETSLARGSYLLGRHSIRGWWYYFPLAMLFKTPLATLALIVLAIGCGIVLQKKSRLSFDQIWIGTCLLIPLILYLTTAMTTHLNLGIRHVLPIYPFIFLLVAMSLAKWQRAQPRRVTVIAGILLLGLVAESLASWPNYIPFFNVTSGGSRGGLRLLGDSNLDWGQDLPALAVWQDHHPNTRLYFSYFGSADPLFYGLRYNPEPGFFPLDPPVGIQVDQPGVFAISASNLQAIYYSKGQIKQVGPLLDYLNQHDPIEVLGGSIYLYDFEPAEYQAFLARNHLP